MDDDAVAWRRPARQGEAWSEEDYEHLLQGLVEVRPLEQLADELQRSPGAVTSQLRRLVHVDAEVHASDRTRWLREQLTGDTDYDWRAALRSHDASTDHGIWFAADDEYLRAGWHQRTPLSVLAAQLGVSEPVVVDRLLHLELAEHVAAVVDRLGATPGGSTEARARVLRGHLPEAIYVLIVDGGRRPRVTTHHSRQAAEAQLRRTVGDPAAYTGRWWVLCRTLDGRDVGPAWASRAPRPAEALPPPDTGTPQHRPARRLRHTD